MARFRGFTRWVSPLLEELGHSVNATYDLKALVNLQGYDLVILDTCLSTKREDGSPAANILTDENATPLAEWVAGGGALLAMHAATVSGQTSSIFRKLVGGVFIEHPPQFTFPVYPIFGEHPLTTGIEAFTVHDEFYIERPESDIQVHMLATDRGIAYPMVWSRVEGKGRVAHIAMGHDQKVWVLPPYRQLVTQAVRWVTGR